MDECLVVLFDVWMNERLVCCLEDGYLLLIWVDKWMIAK